MNELGFFLDTLANDPFMCPDTIIVKWFLLFEFYERAECVYTAP